MAISHEKWTFDNGRGETLAGRLESPEQPRAHALFAHCFTCSKDIAAASRIAKGLCDEGIAVLRFDFTGLGNSEGDFANTNFSSNVEDLLAAARTMADQGSAPQLLIGHSLGGAAVLAAAGRIESCRAVATIGAPSDPGHVEKLLRSSRDEIEREGVATVELAGRAFRIKKQFLDDIRAGGLTDAVGRLRRALLIFHAPFDNIVGIDEAAAIFTAAKHPKSFVSLDDADHLLSRREDSRYVARVLSAWATRFLEPAADADGETAPARTGEDGPAEDGWTIVEEDGPRYRQAVRARRHLLQADEPEDAGGGDRGATPYEQLLAGLGACTSMTLRMYADRKEWPLENVRVRLRHDRIHARDCADCETKEGRLDRIRRQIRLEGDLSEEQRERLMEMADRCPVHRTLGGEIRIETGLDDG
jgi:putative redox protein